MQVEVGAVLTGKVTAITKYGAFVDLSEGKSGMIHISEVAASFVKEIRDYLTENQEVKVKVIGIDEKNRISLSIKQLEPAPAPQARRERNTRPRTESVEFQKPRPVPGTFEEMMARFKQDSDEKISVLRRNTVIDITILLHAFRDFQNIFRAHAIRHTVRIRDNKAAVRTQDIHLLLHTGCDFLGLS
jgi:S1 RNA binding domain protein